MNGPFVYSLVLECSWATILWTAPRRQLLSSWLGLLNMALWLGFSFYTHTWGFIFGVCLGTAIYLRNMRLACRS